VLRNISIALVLALVTCCGCVHTLPITPYVLRDGSGAKALNELPPELHTADMTMFYVTDREQEQRKDRVDYTHKRGSFISYGRATVHPIGATWDELVARTKGPDFNRTSILDVAKVEELGEFVPSNRRLAVEDGHLVLTGEAERKAEERKAQAILAAELAKTPHKDVYIYIHGFNNTFDEALMTMARIWHNIGRRGVAIVYSWPAGRGGVFGYLYDRESGEYTIYNLKRTLTVIAGTPGVERVHIIAHSRGTDIAVTALRELNIGYRAAGKDPQKELKLQTLVLAAPDIDADVFDQRFSVELLSEAANQVVVYTSPEDFALEVASFIFDSDTRLGRMNDKTLTADQRERLREYPRSQIVDCQVSGFETTHGYVFGDPAALSDLILVLRDGRPPGKQYGRPLENKNGVWILDNNYFKRRP
jgi:esterase/lipase superfamily enzyme